MHVHTHTHIRRKICYAAVAESAATSEVKRRRARLVLGRGPLGNILGCCRLFSFRAFCFHLAWLMRRRCAHVVFSRIRICFDSDVRLQLSSHRCGSAIVCLVSKKCCAAPERMGTIMYMYLSMRFLFTCDFLFRRVADQDSNGTDYRPERIR